jgi:hypothetical protein
MSQHTSASAGQSRSCQKDPGWAYGGDVYLAVLDPAYPLQQSEWHDRTMPAGTCTIESVEVFPPMLQFHFNEFEKRILRHLLCY